MLSSMLSEGSLLYKVLTNVVFYRGIKFPGQKKMTTAK